MVPLGSAHGRFQVFHNGHLEYVLAAKKRCEHLLIGITSFNIRSLRCENTAPHRSMQKNNPLTYFERSRMIAEVLIEAGLAQSEFSITPFPIEDPSLLPDFVPQSAPCFTTVYDEWNREKIRLLEKHGYRVHVLWEREDKVYSGSIIRKLIEANDDSWRSMVPRATIRTIERTDLSGRFRE